MYKYAKSYISFSPNQIDQGITCYNPDQIFPRRVEMIDGKKDGIEQRRPLPGKTFRSG
jgi:hypothetical protein